MRLQLQVSIEEVSGSGWDMTCKPLSRSCLALSPCINVYLNACEVQGALFAEKWAGPGGGDTSARGLREVARGTGGGLWFLAGL